MRLTEKINNYYFSKGKIESDHNEEINKLGQLEDIEEELGIYLLTLLDALTQGIYIKPNNIYVGSPYLCFAENENRELEFQFKVVDTWYKVKDYGKTWALTKEELTNGK